MTRTIDDILLVAAKLYEDGEYGKAIEKLSTLLEVNASAPAFHLRSRCYRAAGDNQNALADLNQSLSIDPNNAQGYRERAQLHFLTKRSDLAFEDNRLAERYSGEAALDDDCAEEYADDEDDDEDEEDELFDRVYEARELFFEDRFGPLPADVIKLNNLMGVWPGGCLVQFTESDEPFDPCSVTATFGLTNPDMPASVRSEDVVHEERTEGDKLLRSTSMKLVARERVDIPAGFAGYGYELIVITPEPAEWPALFLSWAVTNEINHDAGWLQRILDEQAIVVKCPLRDHPRLKLLLAKADDPLPSVFTLPNGKAHLLVATSITDSEYNFAAQYGAPALLERLLVSPTGQTSVFFRQPCV